MTALTLRSECRVTPNLAIRRDERVSLRCVQLVGIAPARSVRPFETAVPTARRDASEQNRVEPFDFVPVPIDLLSHVVPRHPCSGVLISHRGGDVCDGRHACTKPTAYHPLPAPLPHPTQSAT